MNLKDNQKKVSKCDSTYDFSTHVKDIRKERTLEKYNQLQNLNYKQIGLPQRYEIIEYNEMNDSFVKARNQNKPNDKKCFNAYKILNHNKNIQINRDHSNSTMHFGNDNTRSTSSLMKQKEYSKSLQGKSLGNSSSMLNLRSKQLMK